MNVNELLEATSKPIRPPWAPLRQNNELIKDRIFTVNDVYMFDIWNGLLVWDADWPIDGAPMVVRGNLIINNSNSKIKSLVGGPTEVTQNMTVIEGALTNFDGFPKSVGKDLNVHGNDMISLKNIERYLKHVGGTIFFSKNPIVSHVLGVCLIKGLKEVVLNNSVVSDILNKHLGKGRAGVMAAQIELIEAGYEDYAQL